MCGQVLQSVSQTWANPSAVKHTPLEQQLYVSKALLLSVSLLSDSELQPLRSGTTRGPTPHTAHPEATASFSITRVSDAHMEG